ncbi:MAG TPA: Ada metal-binding domain-containing protein [Balneolaceae bacterium]|nr:Ada metal-binding domain-containing protein [Balneolaceae bacterium]
MIKQSQLGLTIKAQKKEIRRLIKRSSITLAGNQKLKIYGRLDCASGKQLNPQSRVFFEDERDALKNGYRPCGNCMPEKYRKWKSTQGPPEIDH